MVKWISMVFLVSINQILLGVQVLNNIFKIVLALETCILLALNVRLNHWNEALTHNVIENVLQSYFFYDLLTVRLSFTTFFLKLVEMVTYFFSEFTFNFSFFGEL